MAVQVWYRFLWSSFSLLVVSPLKILPPLASMIRILFLFFPSLCLLERSPLWWFLFLQSLLTHYLSPERTLTYFSLSLHSLWGSHSWLFTMMTSKCLFWATFALQNFTFKDVSFCWTSPLAWSRGTSSMTRSKLTQSLPQIRHSFCIPWLSRWYPAPTMKRWGLSETSFSPLKLIVQYLRLKL